MKNIHVIPTEKPSRLFKFANQLHLDTIPKDYYKKYNIYITSDEEIKFDEYYLGEDSNIYCLVSGVNYNGKKIILTTDQDLIEDGIQAIDNTFLEWFVKNPSCEFVEVVREMYMPQSNGKISDGKITHELSLNESLNTLPFYRIIIPQEKPKQETLEEAAKRTYQKGLQDDIDLSFYDGVRLGAKWQAERMYSEEDLRRVYTVGKHGGVNQTYYDFDEWFEQIKKK
jgi:hypothetical protein